MSHNSYGYNNRQILFVHNRDETIKQLEYGIDHLKGDLKEKEHSIVECKSRITEQSNVIKELREKVYSLKHPKYRYFWQKKTKTE